MIKLQSVKVHTKENLFHYEKWRWVNQSVSKIIDCVLEATIFQIQQENTKNYKLLIIIIIVFFVVFFALPFALQISPLVVNYKSKPVSLTYETQMGVDHE